jgi:hypothetical protein
MAPKQTLPAPSSSAARLAAYGPWANNGNLFVGRPANAPSGRGSGGQIVLDDIRQNLTSSRGPGMDESVRPIGPGPIGAVPEAGSAGKKDILRSTPSGCLDPQIAHLMPPRDTRQTCHNWMSGTCQFGNNCTSSTLSTMKLIPLK